jgi:RNA polymerase sigma-70 factor (ECF subfamily)
MGQREAAVIPQAADQRLSDEEVIARVGRGEVALFEVVMRRYNQRLYRTARAITGDDREAEDVVQEAYVRAYSHLEQFAGRAHFATWLTKITIHEALARLRRRGRFVDLEEAMPTLSSSTPSPEQRVASKELGKLVEGAVDALPVAYRAVFVLRDVEGLSMAETAASLDIPEQTAKTRLHRARTLLRNHLSAQARAALPGAFQFAGARCDRIVATVLSRIARLAERDA